MTLQSAIEAELPFLRAEAEARMTSRVRIRRAGGTTVVDGYQVNGWTDVAADMPFRLAGAERGGAGSRRVTVGETEVEVAVRVGHLPAAQSDLRDKDVIEITAGDNAGTFLQVIEATWQDQATARRVPVFEIDEPEGWTP